MPIFEYKCAACGHVTSFLEPRGSRKAHKCESCGSADTSKMLSTFAAQSSSSRPGECATCDGPTCGDAPCRTGSCPF